jgi:hypothetical protein
VAQLSSQVPGYVERTVCVLEPAEVGLNSCAEKGKPSGAFEEFSTSCWSSLAFEKPANLAQPNIHTASQIIRRCRQVEPLQTAFALDVIYNLNLV